MSGEHEPNDGSSLCRGAALERVRLNRCAHGCFHLYLGPQTLHLNVRDVMLIGQAINRWVRLHPEALRELDDAEWRELERMIELD